MIKVLALVAIIAISSTIAARSVDENSAPEDAVTQHNDESNHITVIESEVEPPKTISENVPKASEEFFDEETKIAIGIKANKTQRTDYTLLKITFINQEQLCGGALLSSEWILTSATCLSE